MQWSDVESRWRDVIQLVCKRWPELDRTRLSALNGSLAELAEYLSEVYELTLAEAKETIEDWLFMASAQLAVPVTASR